MKSFFSLYTTRLTKLIYLFAVIMNYLDDTNSNRIKRKSAFINIYILFFYETIARCFLFNSEDLLDDIMTFDDLHYLHFFFLFSLEMIAEPLIWDLQLIFISRPRRRKYSFFD